MKKTIKGFIGVSAEEFEEFEANARDSGVRGERGEVELAIGEKLYKVLFTIEEVETQ